MLTVFDHALALMLVVLFPLRAATFGFRRLLRTPSEQLPAMRRRVYREAIAIQWSLVAAVVALWLWYGREWSGLGLIPHLTPGLIGTIVGAAIVIVMIWRQRAAAIEDEETLARLRQRMRHLEVMLPHARSEMPGFSALSVTAGICEELLFRGYLIWYFVHWLGLIPAAIVTSVLFGLGHAYQGVRGMIVTALFGAFLAAIYLVTGSLIMPMILHAAMDLHSGSLMLSAWEREAAARASAEAAMAEAAMLDANAAPDASAAPPAEPHA
jgi:membrane protease YdiL (CAAX protease family)